MILPFILRSVQRTCPSLPLRTRKASAVKVRQASAVKALSFFFFASPFYKQHLNRNVRGTEKYLWRLVYIEMRNRSCACGRAPSPSYIRATVFPLCFSLSLSLSRASFCLPTYLTETRRRYGSHVLDRHVGDRRFAVRDKPSQTPRGLYERTCRTSLDRPGSLPLTDAAPSKAQSRDRLFVSSRGKMFQGPRCFPPQYNFPPQPSIFGDFFRKERSPSKRNLACTYFINSVTLLPPIISTYLSFIFFIYFLVYCFSFFFFLFTGKNYLRSKFYYVSASFPSIFASRFLKSLKRRLHYKLYFLYLFLFSRIIFRRHASIFNEENLSRKDLFY